VLDGHPVAVGSTLLGQRTRTVVRVYFFGLRSFS
jgi:hypothetical protein